VAGLLCPDPLGELMRSTDPLAVMGAYLTGEREGKGLLLRRAEGREGRREGMEMKRKGIRPKSR